MPDRVYILEKRVRKEKNINSVKMLGKGLGKNKAKQGC